MNTKRNVVVPVLAALLLMLVGGVFYLYRISRPVDQVAASKVIVAAWSYAGSLRAQGRPVPEFVTLRELIAGGFLTEANVRGFAGVEVSVNLHADPNRPAGVLLRARMPSGVEMITRVDGSIQQAGKP